MKALLTMLLAVSLMGCSAVTVTDGTADQLLGSGTIDECNVKVNKDFLGTLTYKSETCDITITQ